MMSVGGKRRVLESAAPLHVIVTQKHREAVRQTAQDLGLSQSELVRDALDQYLAGVGSGQSRGQ
jgi:hypothetical protein